MQARRVSHEPLRRASRPLVHLTLLGLVLVAGASPASWTSPAAAESAIVLVPRPRVRGEEPARGTVDAGLRSHSQARSAENWAQLGYEALRKEGWIWARLRPHGLADGGRAELWVEAGPRARIGELEFRAARDPDLIALFQEISGLRPGALFRPGGWTEQVRRGLRALGERGYPFASLSVLSEIDHPERSEVDLVLLLSEGARSTIGAVEIVGATHTRADVLRRLAGVELGAPYRESILRTVRDRLRARRIVEDVERVDIVPHGYGAGEVLLRMHVRQPRALNRISAAVGLVQRESQGSRLSGTIDLSLMDLFGTARQLELHWLDDGLRRRRLDLAYLEPLFLGSFLDLELGIGQRHEDELFDTVLGDLAARLPWSGAQTVDLGLGIDRTTFVGPEARVRQRNRARVALRLWRARPALSGRYGRLDSSVEAAWVRESRRDEEGSESVAQAVTQTIVEATGRFGWALGPRLAVESRVAWQSTSSSDTRPLPRSEQWYVGGATTVRGYREEQFNGEWVAYGGLELLLGRAGRGQGYIFYDLGWVRETREESDGLRRTETWLHGFGLGLRSPTLLGSIDVSVGFGGELSYDAGLLHLALTQSF
jgi:outer membrane protein insertion porin family